MKNLILLLLFISTARGVSAQGSDKGLIKITVPGVGVAQLVHENIGEPIGAPERISLSIKCKKSGQVKEVGLFRGCKLESHTFESETKILVLKIISARIVHNSGDVVCDQVDQKQIDLKSVCN